MKKKIILTAGFVLAIIIGCTNDEIIPIEGSDVLTRAVAQTIFSNQTVTSNRTVTGTDILSENITVSNGAKLILKGSQSITINKPYTIEKERKKEGSFFIFSPSLPKYTKNNL